MTKGFKIFPVQQLLVFKRFENVLKYNNVNYVSQISKLLNRNLKHIYVKY